MRPVTVPALLRIAVILFISAILFAACKKDKQGEPELTRRDMLLGTWRRILRASDYNNNQIIDSAEIIRAPATDTLMLTLAPDATFTRTLTFKGVGFPEFGTWHLQQEDVQIVLQPATSTSRTDTLSLDTVSQGYFSYHIAYPDSIRTWESFVRP